MEEKGRQGEKEHKMFSSGTSVGNPNLSAFAVLSARSEADFQGKQLSKSGRRLSQSVKVYVTDPRDRRGLVSVPRLRSATARDQAFER